MPQLMDDPKRIVQAGPWEEGSPLEFTGVSPRYRRIIYADGSYGIEFRITAIVPIFAGQAEPYEPKRRAGASADGDSEAAS
jgi:hypothetical protein